MAKTEIRPMKMMKMKMTKLGASLRPKRTLVGQIAPGKVVVRDVSKRTMEYVMRRDREIFAALARADSEDD